MALSYAGNNNEALLFKVLKDLEPYKEQAVLIGGWLPYIYVHFLWQQTKPVKIVATYDIDIALNEAYDFQGKLITEHLGSISAYRKQPLYDKEPTPFAFLLKEQEQEMRLDFISHELMDPAIMKKMAGRNLAVIPLTYIDILLKQENIMELHIKNPVIKTSLRIPYPAVYVFVKGLTLDDMDDKQNSYKLKKDLWTIYFVLENIPLKDMPALLEKIIAFKETDKEYYEIFKTALNTYFKSPESLGPKAVSELINLPADFISKRSHKVVYDFLQKI